MAPALRSTARLGLWTTALVAALRLLAATGGGSLSIPVSSPRHLPAWVAETAPPDMAIALLRLGALALAGYLLAVTVLAVVARRLRLDGLAVAVERISPGVVRRLVSGGSGIGLALGAVAGVVPGLEQRPRPTAPTAAAAAPSADKASAIMTRLPAGSATMTRLATGPGTPPNRGSAEATMTRIGDVPPPTATMTRVGADTPSRPPAVGGAPAAHDPASPTPATPAAVRPPPDLPLVDPSRWVVEPGDSLWSIADEVVRRADGSSPGERAVARYWHRLIGANRQDLVDPANPDLLVPGQRLVVPPLER